LRGGVGEDRELIAAKRLRSEYVDDCELDFPGPHAILPWHGTRANWHSSTGSDAAGARAKIKSGDPGLPDRRLVTSEIRALTCRR
jgi:hypothetical protein